MQKEKRLFEKLSIEQKENVKFLKIVNNPIAQKEPCQWQKALENLTPGGSEFSGDLDYCLSYIKENQAYQDGLIKKLMKENKVLKSTIKQLK